MDVEGGGEDGSDGGGDGGSEPSGLSPSEDDEDDGGDEPAEEPLASSGALSSRTILFPSVSLLSERRESNHDCVCCRPRSEGDPCATME
jgi:hypothetical protein